jgi:hypothetical protein
MVHGVLRLRLLVPEVLDVRVSQRAGDDAHAESSDHRGGDQALASGGGEETHR